MEEEHARMRSILINMVAVCERCVAGGCNECVLTAPYGTQDYKLKIEALLKDIESENDNG